MLLRSWRFVTVMFAALTMSMSLCHWMEMPAKMALNWPGFIVVQSMQNPFLNFEVLLEVISILGVVGLMVFTRKRKQAFVFAGIGAICLVLSLLIWQIGIAPINDLWDTSSIVVPPLNWETWRSQWQVLNILRALLQIVGFGVVTLSVVIDTPREFGANEVREGWHRDKHASRAA